MYGCESWTIKKAQNRYFLISKFCLDSINLQKNLCSQGSFVNCTNQLMKDSHGETVVGLEGSGSHEETATCFFLFPGALQWCRQ